MIEWEGYRLSSATWETKEHVTPYLMAEYDGPHMSDVGLTHEAVNRTFLGIQRRMRESGNSPVQVTFFLDVSRSNFGVKGGHAVMLTSM